LESEKLIQKNNQVIWRFHDHWRARRPDPADVLVVGEIREWEGVEYAHDTVAAGYSKGLILLGYAISEDPGMDGCARWLKTFLPVMPVEFVPAGEPGWSPGRI